MKTIKKSKNNNYIVAIPSYKRYNEITRKTLPTLKKGKVPVDKIYVSEAMKRFHKANENGIMI